jgi:NitT/TauT family transport system permease protein
MSGLTIRPVEADAPPIELTRGSGALRGRLLILLLQIGCVGLVIGLWQLAASTGLVDRFFISSPVVVAKRLWEFRNEVGGVTPGSIWPHVAITLREAVYGLVTGSLVGTLVGFLLAQSRWVAAALHPLLNLANTLPRVALGPLFILWFGLGETSKSALVFTVVVFILLFNTYAGVQTVDHDLVSATRLLGARWYAVLWKITLPSCIPWIMAGLRIALAWSLGAAVVGEYLGARGGVGYLIFNFSNVLDQTGVIAGCMVLLLMSFVLFGLLAVFERRLLRWRVRR